MAALAAIGTTPFAALRDKEALLKLSEDQIGLLEAAVAEAVEWGDGIGAALGFGSALVKLHNDCATEVMKALAGFETVPLGALRNRTEFDGLSGDMLDLLETDLIRRAICFSAEKRVYRFSPEEFKGQNVAEAAEQAARSPAF